VVAHWALRKDLEAVLGNADRMLELRRKRAIARDRSPAVVEQLHVRTAYVDHRLDREEHPGSELWAGARSSRMDHLRAVVE